MRSNLMKEVTIMRFCSNCKTLVKPVVKPIEQHFNINGKEITVTSEALVCTLCGEPLYAPMYDRKAKAKALKQA